METLKLVIFEKTHEAAIERGLVAARELLGPPENSNVAGERVMRFKVHRIRPDRTERVGVGDWYIDSAESDGKVVQLLGDYEASTAGVETTIIVRRRS